ncbi:hypothetical protein DEO72_LG3g746 [Vigna unguiculata]|uniref:Uncharacterized protein n=1 Tax=Vigna unguiculata TaxID=3917 RepID=A0A4D6LD09_VIGUN|nr:hypothetical protein DEO72_LG3g746 [Vigna unguiculata]
MTNLCFLLNWLFQYELLFQLLIEALVSIVARKHMHDHYLLLGWCLLIQNMVEFENFAHQSILVVSF